MHPNDASADPLDFSGEFFIPGKSGESLEKEHRERYLFAGKFVKNKSVLDIACGVGYAAPILVASGAQSYEGVDIRKSNIEHAERLYRSDIARFSLGDICTFNTGKTYDVIVCYETIEHVPNYRSALKNLHRHAGGNGILIISSPNRILSSPEARSVHDKPDNEFHSQEFTLEELIAELRIAGFEVKRENIFGQMQRRMYHNKFIREAARIFLGRPERNASPEVTPVRKKAPGFFVLVASKV